MYALFGRKQYLIAKIVWFFLIIMIFYFYAYLIWVIFGIIMGLNHPPLYDEYTELDKKRKILGYIIILIFILIYIPVPMRFDM